MAIKVINHISKENSLPQEIELLKRIKNANIVSYFGTCKENDNTLWIITDLCELGSIKVSFYMDVNYIINYFLFHLFYIFN